MRSSSTTDPHGPGTIAKRHETMYKAETATGEVISVGVGVGGQGS